MQKGFTLIELLVVIAILAILAIAVVISLNPAELLKQSRDSTRLSDLHSLTSALALYLADVSTTTWVTTTTCTASGSGLPVSCVVNGSTAINGTGWVPINLTAISSGAPLSKLPVDPVNGSCTATPSSCLYIYKSFSTFGEYKIYANLESNKYASGAQSLEATDGGATSTWYEVGTKIDQL